MQILTSCQLCNHRRLNVITKQEQKRSKYRLWASPLTAGFMFLGTQQVQSIYGGHLEAATCPNACHLLNKMLAAKIKIGEGLIRALHTLGPHDRERLSLDPTASLHLSRFSSACLQSGLRAQEKPKDIPGSLGLGPPPQRGTKEVGRCLPPVGEEGWPSNPRAPRYPDCRR